MKKRMLCGFMVLMLLCGCTPKKLEGTVNPHREYGEQQSELSYDEHYVTSLTYPKTDIEELDTAIVESVRHHQDRFLAEVANYKEEAIAEFNVSYQSYIKDDRYISVKLDFYRTIYQTSETVETFVYDSEERKLIDLYDIYEDEALPDLSAFAVSYFQKNFPQECNTQEFKIASAPTIANYNQFVLRKDAIVFYFQEGTLFDRLATLEVPYEQIEDHVDMREERQVFVAYDQVLNEPVKEIDPNKPMVALTLDDGPSKKYTPIILDALREYNASATFFVLGSKAESEPELLQRMILEGNEIGNHTYSHKQLTTLSKERIEDEIAHTQEVVYKVTSTYPQMIRPPYGSRNDTVFQCAADKKIVAWTIDTEDWRSQDVQRIVEKVLNEVEDGSIILMHDMYASTAEAVKILVPELQDRGYQLVTVSDLYAYGKNKAGKIMEGK